MSVQTKHVARKQHRCDWCGERIAVGERYARSVAFGEGTARTLREHLECTAFVESRPDVLEACDIGEHWPLEMAIRGGLRDE